jgi:cellulose synthase/poly-beta-1,6-N-acetylglucosamine synthase-like glycosyltransferase
MAPRDHAALVSIVIPCYNQGCYVSDAIESARGQSYRPIEIVVVDDGSCDDSATVVAAYPDVRLIRHAHRGLIAARNAGLAAARGEYVIFLDADDCLTSDAAAIGVSLLDEHRDAALAAGRCLVMDQNRKPLPTKTQPVVDRDFYAALLAGNYIWTPGAAVMRRDAVIGAGGYPHGHAGSADYALYLRLARAHAFACHERCVVWYRQHAANMSRHSVAMLDATLAVLDEERAHVPIKWAEAFRRSRRAWIAFYSDRIIEDIRTAWRGGDIARAVRYALALARRNPAACARHLGRKITRVAPSLRPRVPPRACAPRVLPATGAETGSPPLRQ